MATNDVTTQYRAEHAHTAQERALIRRFRAMSPDARVAFQQSADALLARAPDHDHSAQRQAVVEAQPAGGAR